MGRLALAAIRCVGREAGDIAKDVLAARVSLQDVVALEVISFAAEDMSELDVDLTGSIAKTGMRVESDTLQPR